MKLAYSAWAMPRLPVAEQIAIVRSLGYAGIELVSMPNASTDAQKLDAAERRRIRQLLDDAGLELTAIAGHGNLLEPDPTQRAANVARIEAAIDLAVDLAGSSGPPPVVAMGYGTPENYETDRHALAGGFASLADYAKQRGVVVALEPHVNQAIDLPEKVVWLLDRVNSPHFRLNFDNSHFEVMGCDLADYVPQLVPYAVHTHLKDQRGIAPNFEFLVPGEGDFDYVRYLQLMNQAGYHGYITVEISVMVQRRPNYDPAATAAQCYKTLTRAASEAGVALATRG